MHTTFCAPGLFERWHDPSCPHRSRCIAAHSAEAWGCIERVKDLSRSSHNACFQISGSCDACVGKCLSEWDREGGREGGRVREGRREGGRERCVNVCFYKKGTLLSWWIFAYEQVSWENRKMVVRVRSKLLCKRRTHTHTHTHRERERERERDARARRVWLFINLLW